MKKTFDFQPKLFSALKTYSKEKFMTDLMAGIIVGIVALPLAIAFGIASGRESRKGFDYRHHRRIRGFAARRQLHPDRRADGSLYYYCIWHHPELRARGTGHRDGRGGHPAGRHGRAEAGDGHQVYPLPPSSSASRAESP